MQIESRNRLQFWVDFAAFGDVQRRVGVDLEDPRLALVVHDDVDAHDVEATAFAAFREGALHEVAQVGLH